MENAVKALLIAAAVLVAILLISLGVGIFNSASEQMDGADLSEYQIEQFNNKFKKYEGRNASGAEVNALLTTVFNHNMLQEDESTRVLVHDASDGVDIIDTKGNYTQSPKKYSTATRYDITCQYNSSTKLINQITIDTTY